MIQNLVLWDGTKGPRAVRGGFLLSGHEDDRAGVLLTMLLAWMGPDCSLFETIDWIKDG